MAIWVRAIKVPNRQNSRLSGDYPLFSRAAPPAGPVTAVFALIGQSNMVGRASDDGGQSYPSGVFEYTTAGGLAVPSGPLSHPADTGSGEPSIGLAFAIAYKAANPNNDIVLVPAASGGTGFVDNSWNSGDPLYNDAVNAVNQCLSENPDFVFGGFLWHQGEKDGLVSASSTYEANLTAMVSAMRTDVTGASGTTPFVVGGLLPSFNDAEVPEVKAILEDAPNFLDYAGYADSAGLGGIDDRNFNASSLRTLGGRYFDAYEEAQVDVPGSPGEVTGLAASTDDGEVSLSWETDPDATSYRVLRATSSGGPYSLVTTVSVTSYTDTGLTNGTAYYYVVEAENASGTGPPSDEVEATPAVPVPFTDVGLFAGGEAGFIHDLTEKTYLSTDLAGTTALTASGDPIGHVEDATGNGNNLSAPTTSNRPTYTESGTEAWAQMASGGTTQLRLEADIPGFSSVDDITVVVAYSTHANSSERPLAMINPAGVGEDRVLINTDVRRCSYQDASVAEMRNDTTASDTSGDMVIASLRKDGSEGTHYVNGTLVETDTGLGTFAADIGSNEGGATALRGDGSKVAYRLVIGRALTNTELSDLHDLVKSKIGMA